MGPCQLTVLGFGEGGFELQQLGAEQGCFINQHGQQLQFDLVLQPIGAQDDIQEVNINQAFFELFFEIAFDMDLDGAPDVRIICNDFLQISGLDPLLLRSDECIGVDINRLPIAGLGVAQLQQILVGRLNRTGNLLPCYQNKP
jgi:hypothetical protein